MRTMIAVGLLALVATVSYGRIRETRTQCDARYGATQTNALGMVHYAKSGWTIFVTFDTNSVAREVKYMQLGEMVSRDEKIGLLKLIAPFEQWKLTAEKTAWLHEGEEIIAENMKGGLNFLDLRWFNEQQKIKAKKSLDGL